MLNFQAANPATLVSALQTGLQYTRWRRSCPASRRRPWQSEQKPYAAAGAFIVDNYIAAAPSGVAVMAGRATHPRTSAQGTVLADEQIANSGGEPSKSLIVSVPTYMVFDPLVACYKAEIAKACPGCQVTEDIFTLPQMLGRNLVPAVVSAAKRIGGLKYIISVNGAFTDTLPEALKAAGLRGKYQIISGTGVSTDQQSVLERNQLATVSGPFILGGWQTMDMAVRSVMKLPPSPGDNVVPWVLLKKSNIGTPSDSYDVPTDYPSLFEKLWHVG